jgi:signal peptidase I
MSKNKLRREHSRPGKESGVRENIKMLLEVMVTVLFINGFLLQSFVIPTGSMENHMLVGDHLLVDKVAYSQPLSPADALVLPQRNIERGMIVVFKAPPAIAARDWSHLTYRPDGDGPRFPRSRRALFLYGRQPLYQRRLEDMGAAPGRPHHRQTLAELLVLR